VGFGRAAPSSNDGLSPSLSGGETEEIELIGDEERAEACLRVAQLYARDTVSLLRFGPKW
jgi:hypothetical protein